MTAVFLHGVPETASIWDPLIAELDRDDAITIALPGFGTPLPEGFEPTMFRYADYLAAEIASIDGPVDLVGHDWGSILSLRVLSYQPANIRSFAIDMGAVDDTFEWHDMAKLWISDEGEGFMEGMVGASNEDLAMVLASTGVPDVGSLQMAEGFDELMASSILTLCRSAYRLGHDWGAAIDNISMPGLAIKAGNDPFQRDGSTQSLVDRTGATVGELPDDGHWWMVSNPTGGAALLQDFWATL